MIRMTRSLREKHTRQIEYVGDRTTVRRGQSMIDAGEQF